MRKQPAWNDWWGLNSSITTLFCYFEWEILTFIFLVIALLCVPQEAEIQSIRREIQQIADGEAPCEDNELNELVTENMKLKHRLIILNKVKKIELKLSSSTELFSIGIFDMFCRPLQPNEATQHR